MSIIDNGYIIYNIVIFKCYVTGIMVRIENYSNSWPTISGFRRFSLIHVEN